MPEICYDLIMRTHQIRKDFYDSMLPYVTIFDKKKDARVTLFSKCINVLDSTFLSFYYYNFYLKEPNWWKEIPTKLPVNLPAAEDIIQHVNTFAISIKISFIQLLHSCIESSVRPIVEKYNYEEYNKRADSFGRIYKWFFKDAKLSIHITLLDMLSAIRNVAHDNGVYFGNNKDIQIDGTLYKFEDRKLVDFITWDFLFNLMPKIRNMLIVIAEKTKGIRGEITDLSII